MKMEKARTDVVNVELSFKLLELLVSRDDAILCSKDF